MCQRSGIGGKAELHFDPASFSKWRLLEEGGRLGVRPRRSFVGRKPPSQCRNLLRGGLNLERHGNQARSRNDRAHRADDITHDGHWVSTLRKRQVSRQRWQDKGGAPWRR